MLLLLLLLLCRRAQLLRAVVVEVPLGMVTTTSIAAVTIVRVCHRAWSSLSFSSQLSLVGGGMVPAVFLHFHFFDRFGRDVYLHTCIYTHDNCASTPLAIMRYRNKNKMKINHLQALLAT